jgi:hypothetical protein
MKTINNTEPIPMIPQGCKGEWKWNGWEITSTGRDSVTGEVTQRKGKWMWLPKVDDSQNAWMAHATPQEISKHFKPKDNTSNIATAIIFGALAITVTVIAIVIL